MRIFGIVLTVLFGAPFLMFSWLALSSRFGGADTDMHGYALIFGSLFAMALAIPVALSVPLIFPKPKRTTAMFVSVIVLVIVDAGLLFALTSA